MFRLTREVRFAVNQIADEQLKHPPSNSFGGYPSLNGFGQFLRVQVTLAGQLDPQSGYLTNIKEIDQAVREKIIGRKGDLSAERNFLTLRDAFAGHALDSVSLWLSPTLSATQLASEIGMYTRLSQRFEFSASHRLYNAKISDDENRKVYGKCTNPNGHGHNYELQVTLRGKPRADGLIVDVPAFERIVKESVVDHFDHKHLNLDMAEFRELIPTVENISMVIYKMLKGKFGGIGAELAGVTVWETPKTWCEYSE